MTSNINRTTLNFKKRGKMKTLNKLSDILSENCNWFCEHKSFQNVLRQQSKNFDMPWSQYTTTYVVESYTINIGRHAITDKKWKFFN